MDKFTMQVTFDLTKTLEDEIAEKAFDVFNGAVGSVSAYLRIEGYEVVAIETQTGTA